MILYDMALNYRCLKRASHLRFHRLDLVRCGSLDLPVLCVSRIFKDSLECWWIDERGKHCRAVFPMNDLYRVACWDWQKKSLIEENLSPDLMAINEI